jgi:hypothetical protein
MDTKLPTKVDQSTTNKKIEILKETCGAWDRPESLKESVRQAREAFRPSMERHNE